MQITGVGDVELAYELIGEGPTVLLIGGVDMDAPVMKNAYGDAFLADGYRVLLVNLRGMPPSTVTPPPYDVSTLVGDCVGLLRSLGIEDCFVVGASLGALVAQELVLVDPAGKRGLALIATMGRVSAWGAMLVRAELALYEQGMRTPSEYMIASDLLQLYTPDELLNDGRVLRLADLMKQRDNGLPGRRGLMSAVVGYGNRVSALAAIVAPTLLFSFRDDAVTPAALGRELAGAIPGCEHVELQGCGHAGMLTRKSVIAPAILRFFAKYREDPGPGSGRR